jgi:16S rRNA (guanine1207-N2)-methyltransferase
MTIEPLTSSATFAVYGTPPIALADVPPDAIQLSPMMPGAESLEDCEAGRFAALVMLAPPGTVERRYTLALALQATAPGGLFIAMAPKDRGGARLKKELEAFGCTVHETVKSHHRICTLKRPAELPGFTEAVAEGAPRVIAPFGLQSQPGVFSWDRIDPGTALLARTLPTLSGRGADLGCGIGYLARAVLTSPKVERIALIDLDRRAIDAARRNVEDPRADMLWADATNGDAPLSGLDFVVTNPPFHDGGSEDRRLGQAFIRRAASALRKGGSLWLVANRHLPYETVLGGLFTTVEVKAEQGGYKVFEAHK